MQLGNSFNARRVNPALNVFARLFDNAYFLAIMVAAMGMQVLMVEAFGSFANTTHQSWQQWLIAMAFGAASWIWGVVLYFLWGVVCHFIPQWAEDSVSTTDSDAFEGAQLHDKRYSFKRPDNADEVSVLRQRIKSRSSFSHHGGLPIVEGGVASLGAPVAQLGMIGAVTSSGGGSNSRLVSSMSARRANPGGNSARRSGGTVSFQPVGQPVRADGSQAAQGELPDAAAPGGASAAQISASASWPRSVLGPSGEPIDASKAALPSSRKQQEGGVQVIEELDELI